MSYGLTEWQLSHTSLACGLLVQHVCSPTICLCLALHCTADGRQPQGPALDSARQNLASTFVNAFVNAGFGQDKLVTVSSEAAGSDTGMRRSHHVLSWFSCGLARLCYVGNMLTVVRPHCLYRRHAPGINNSSCNNKQAAPARPRTITRTASSFLGIWSDFLLCCAVLCCPPSSLDLQEQGPWQDQCHSQLGADQPVGRGGRTATH